MPVNTRARTPAPAPAPAQPATVSTLPTPASRLTRRTRGTSTPLGDQASTASPSPVPDTETTSSTSTSGSSSSTTPTPPGEEADEMYSTAEHRLRERNIEDLGDVEEKGLLRRRSSSPASNGYDRKGKGKEREVHLEKATFVEEQQEGEGLTSRKDKEAFALLVVLYLLQGVPLGLTFGTLPFLLKPHLSYSQLAIFALSVWPYSLKLLWSPIVDAWFVQKWGRRKSWIVPVQGLVGLGLWIIGGRVEGWLEEEPVDVRFLTAVFGSLILAAATQDIAVDGWALTLLSAPNLSYASTAQTIGLGIGNALAFTVFLAFNSVDFSNKYFRSQPLDYGLVSLGGYMRFWAVVFGVVTVWLARFKTEDPVSEDDPDMDVKKVYKIMWSIVRLKNIQSFLLVHLICKFGFMVNDSVTGLKLLEKGLSKEDLAVAVLLDFPAQMIAGWLAAKWSRPAPASRHPLTGSGSAHSAQSQVLRPWVYAFWARLGMAAFATLVVYSFPAGKISTGYFGLVIATTLLSSLTRRAPSRILKMSHLPISTVQFVGITAFHTQIADPLIGGTYMTLLNTVSNLGGTWPKPLILRSVDLLSSATCVTKAGPAGQCITDHDRAACLAQGATCRVDRDGYYIMSAICVSLAAVAFVGFILPTVRRLQNLPLSAWRVKIPH